MGNFNQAVDLDYYYHLNLKPKPAPEDCPHPWWIVYPPVKKVCPYCGVEKPFTPENKDA